MTALEFIAAGVRFVREGLALRPAAPPWRKDLACNVDAAIASRVARMRDWNPNHAAPYGICAHCGDAMPKYVGGTCELCAVARRIALQLGGVS